MTGRKYLIVNADDLGLSSGVNRGILAAHARGIVTSTSLMVRWPAAAAAAEAALDFPRLSVGLHFDFGEWACRDGEWKLLYEVVPLRDHQQVADEVARQLDTFCHLIGRDPTHLDSHQHIHRKEPLRSVLIDVARRLGVPLRHMDSSIRYCGDFYGQDAEGKAHPELITVGRLNKIFERLPSDWTELACHPGDVESEELDTMYRSERNKEMAVLCGPRLLDMLALRGIQLCSFADFAFARSKGQTAEVLSP